MQLIIKKYNFISFVCLFIFLPLALFFMEELEESHLPHIKASDMHELRLAHETKNMILSAKMKLKASLFRKESRGSHFRLDYPNSDDTNWSAWVNIFKNKDGKMKLEKQPFGTCATV